MRILVAALTIALSCSSSSASPLCASFDASGNVGPGEDEIGACPVPVSAFDHDGAVVSFRSSGRFSNSAYNKNIRAYVGSYAILEVGDYYSGQYWTFTGWCGRRDSTTMVCSASFAAESGQPIPVATTSGVVLEGIDAGAATEIRITGEANEDGDVELWSLVVSEG